MSERFYLLKIQLLDIEPSIWRRFAVPASITLDRLHDVIQIVMGWQDYHLHMFHIGGRQFTEAMEDADFEGEDESVFRLCDFVRNEKQRFRYEYDFGDDWQHELVLEKVQTVPEGYALVLKCLAGKRACPPEDVGGPDGYAEFLEAISNPKHPEHKEYLRWSGGKFKPNFFDTGRVNFELAKYTRWSRPRHNQ